MKLVDLGHGEPLVLIPGIQGRWEWMRPAVEALAERCRVITFSLGDEPTARFLSRAERSAMSGPEGFHRYVEQIAQALDEAGLQRAAICGVSYGGLIATAFAVRHPERVTSLVLVSALPPTWKLDRRASFYLRSPRLFAPLFMISSLRLYREIAVARRGLWNGAVAALAHLGRVARAPFNATRMARRVAMTVGLDWSNLKAVHVPTLLLTGEPSLDRVVPPLLTLDYQRLWPHARHVTLPETGHLGLVTRPKEFASVVASFVDQSVQGAPTRRRVG